MKGMRGVMALAVTVKEGNQLFRTHFIPGFLAHFTDHTFRGSLVHIRPTAGQSPSIAIGAFLDEQDLVTELPLKREEGGRA